MRNKEHSDYFFAHEIIKPESNCWSFLEASLSVILGSSIVPVSTFPETTTQESTRSPDNISPVHDQAFLFPPR